MKHDEQAPLRSIRPQLFNRVSPNSKPGPHRESISIVYPHRDSIGLLPTKLAVALGSSRSISIMTQNDNGGRGSYPPPLSEEPQVDTEEIPAHNQNFSRHLNSTLSRAKVCYLISALHDPPDTSTSTEKTKTGIRPL